MKPSHAKAVVAKLLSKLPGQVVAQVRKVSQPEWVAPMLATLAEENFSRQGWLFEPKFDGVRCLVFCHGGDLRLFSRNQKRLNERYPELVHAFEVWRTLPFIMDGEIVAYQGAVTSFAKLQQRMQVNRPSAELQRKVPVYFCAFDLIYLSEFDLRQVPLRYRKRMLRDVFEFHDPLRYTGHRQSGGKRYYEEACRAGLEGIIAKNGGGRYVSRRSPDWLKFKCVKEQEFVIGGYTDPQGARWGFGALLIGYYSDGRLIYAGKVGTGYDQATLHALLSRLKSIERGQCPFERGDPSPRGAHWVKPKLVAEIGFGEWTADGRLRHPRFLGLRSDKKPKEVAREEVSPH